VELKAVRAPEEAVVVTSRVRLARNYEDIPFVPMINDVWAAETLRRATDAIAKGPRGEDFSLIRMEELSALERTRMVEHHLISYDLLKFSTMAATLLSSGHTISVMVNEEDHLRIQALLPGMQLERVAQMAYEADDWLGARDQYAFDSQWGYLTSCPTNTGSGMRVSAMLHLPALTKAHQMGAVLQGMSKLGLTVRGLYGEGSEAQGNLYQLSNQVTLGRSEEEMLRSLGAACAQVAKRETELREMMLKADAVGMEDHLMRSAGMLKAARKLASAEMMQRFSDLRLAACMDFVDFTPGELDSLMMDLQPASVSLVAGRELDADERDENRAAQCREALKNLQL